MSAHPFPSLPPAPVALDLGSVTLQQIITCEIEGELEFSDMQRLLGAASSQPPATASPFTPDPDLPPPAALDASRVDIQRIRERHHSAARLVAQNFQQGIVASITGYTEAYLSTLLDSPAMRELVGHYRAQQGNSAEIVAERLRTVAMSAVDHLATKLEANPDSLTATELVAVAKLGLDRSGHGPTSTQVHQASLHVVDYAELKRLNRAALASEGDIIDASSSFNPPLPLLPSA
jgi:hypothetical protein